MNRYHDWELGFMWKLVMMTYVFCLGLKYYFHENDIKMD